MMRNISYFKVLTAFFYHPVQALNMNFNPYINILYYQSILRNFLPPARHLSHSYKMKYFIYNRSLEQPGSETR